MRGSRMLDRKALGALGLAALLLLAALPLAAQEAPTPPPQAPEAPASEPPTAEPPERPEPPEPPAPPERPARPGRRSDAQVVVGSNLEVDSDEVSDDVVVVGGNLVVVGEVLGDAMVIGGNLELEGRVSGDVAAIGGSLTLGPGAEIGGDAMSFGGKITQADGARIRGEVVEVSGTGLQIALWPGMLSGWGNHRVEWHRTSPFGWVMRQAWWFFCMILLALLACAALAVARTPVERIGRRVAAEPWKSGLVGLLAQFLFVPLLLMIVVLLCVSIIGIPFLLLLPFVLLALCIVVFFGCVGVALRLGEFLAERFGWSLASPYAALLAGIAALAVWSLLGSLLSFDGPPVRMFAGLFSLFGVLVCFVAYTLAVGGAVLTRFATADGWGSPPPTGALPPPAAPPPPAGPPAGGAEEPWEPEVDERQRE